MEQKLFALSGDKVSFCPLLPWLEINKILAEHRLDEPRLRLSKGGKTIPTHEYTNYFQSRRGGNIPRLMPNKLNEKLIDGATLIIDAVDELYEPIKKLSQDLEIIFNETIQVNAYLGWGNTTGFDTHWDDHDVFILQVFGKKNWFIFGETRKYPLYRDVVIDSDTPKKPIWKKILNQGELLYIPRGWWHNAIPSGNEPSLHLTFGINNRTGIDFFNWFSERLMEDEFFRKDIPYLRAKDELKTYLKQFNTKVKQIFDMSLFETYLTRYNSNALVRPRFTFPHSIYKPSILKDNYEISLSISRKVLIDKNVKSGIISFVANGNEWKFSILTKPLFDLLFKKRKCSIAEAKRVCNKINQETIDLFIKDTGNWII